MNNDALKLCIDCKQEIHADANKCVHCGSYQQGWQKHFSFTTTTLSLLIALISVLGALLPNLLTAIFYSEPRLSVSVRNVNNSGLEMDVVNIGKAAAVLANEIECTRMIYKDESVFADVASQSFDKIINGIANPKSMITFEYRTCCGYGGGLQKKASDIIKKHKNNVIHYGEWSILIYCKVSYQDEFGNESILDINDSRLGQLFGGLNSITQDLEKNKDLLLPNDDPASTSK